MIRQWAKALALDHFFALENETQLETKTNIDDFLAQLQQDPFGLNDAEAPKQALEMEQFQKAQEEIGVNMAVTMFMVEALQYFKAMPIEAIKKNSLRNCDDWATRHRC